MVGSFLNVCIHRIPEGKSIIFPPSSCPSCNKPIAFYDNIPIVSFIILLGKCRNCKIPISPRYPLVEFLTAIFSVTLFAMFGISLEFFVYFVFTASLIVITFVDLQHQIIPDVISLPGIGIGFMKLLAMIGAFLGWKGVIITLFSGSFAGAVIGIILMLAKGKDSRYAIPFGPFLAGGAIVSLFFGDSLIDWYTIGIWK